MKNELRICTVALKLLTEVYKHIDENFVANIDCKSILNDTTSVSDFIIVSKYLKDKNYIEHDIFKGETYTCKITAEGIDWVEFCHGIRPGK